LPEPSHRTVAPPQLGGVRLPWITLGQLVARRAREAPDHEAVSFGDGTMLTCADLDRRSDAIAAAYAELGVGKGDRVLTLLTNSPEQLLSWLAAAKLGAIAVPVNISLRGTDLGHALTVARASVAVIEGELADGYESGKAAAGVTVKHELVVRGARSGYRPFHELERHSVGAPPAVEVGPEDPVCVVFTGGTTGLPKGVLRTHFSYICAGTRYRQAFEPTPEDRHYSDGQMFHIGGQAAFIGPFMNGVPSRIGTWFSASGYWERVRGQRATIIEAVGSRVTLLLRQPPRSDDAENSVRVALSGTRGISPDDRSEFMRRFGVPRLVEVYAMSETGALLFFGAHERQEHWFTLSSHGWCDASVVDEQGFPVELLQTGEILLRPTVPYSASLGYLGDPTATVEHWHNLWIHTGDLGRMHPDGSLEFIGRQAHWLRRRGENVSALEVERVLDEHPKVVESAVVGVPSEFGEEDVRAVVVLEGEASADELFDWCEEHLAYFKVPRYIELRHEPLPRTATKREIERHRIRSEPMRDPAERAPSNPRARRPTVRGAGRA
jgi:carnitine-CoA ligase